jgi:hypothetical protein
VATTTIVTATGDSIVSARMIGTSPSQPEPKVLGWGLGGVAGGPFAAAKSDVAPFDEAPEARVTCTSTQATTTYADDTYQAVGTITCTQGGGETIAEVFLSDSATKPFSTTVTGGSATGSSSGTTLTIAASYTPANGTYVQVRTEVLHVTAGTGTTSLTVTRGANGSAAIATIASGDAVTCGNAPPAGTGAGTGNLFVHATFPGLALNDGDSLQSTISVAFD